MKLITEYTETDVQCIVEKAENGTKSHVIEGVFAQAEGKNRNGRVYPLSVMTPAVEKYDDEQVKTGRAVGELNHPDGPTVNLDKVSHLITELKMDGKNVMGKARILSTPMGMIVSGLLEGGVQLGVSTRGMGSLEPRNGVMYVKDDFMLNTVDIVQDPSAPNAFVNGIMEGVDWIWNNGILEATRQLKEWRLKSRKLRVLDLYEVQVREFKNFLSLLEN